jgi:O-antigen ligase
MFFFYWLIAIMPLDQHPFWGQPLVGTLTIVKLLGIICFLIALYEIAANGASPRFLRSPHARAYLLFLLMQCASGFIHAGQLVFGLTPYSNVFSILTLFVAAQTLASTRARLYWCLLVGIGAVGFVSLYAIRQHQQYGASARPGGMFADSNEYTLVVGMWIPLAFLWAFSKCRPKWERLLCLGCLSSLVLGTTFAASRGGFLGLVAAATLLIFHSQRRIRNFVVVTAVMVPLMVLIPTSPLHRLKNPGYGDQLAEQARLIVWRAGMRMIQAHPLTGIGINNFKPMVTQYEDQNGELVVSLAHNTYVEITAELGIPAVLIFIGILVSAFVAMERVRRRALTVGYTHLSNIALGLQAGIVSYAVSAAFMSAWWQKLVWLMIFLSISVYRLGNRAVWRKKEKARLCQLNSRARRLAAPKTIAVLEVGVEPRRIAE